jgi:thiamine-monophosphate kinase
VSLGEFDLIDQYFGPLGRAGARAARSAPVGIGDDGAVLLPDPGAQLVAVLDTLVEGRHFLPGCDPRSIGHRALAVNLSDIAAMGARPDWYLLALTLPSADPAFLAAFAGGLGDLAAAHDVVLVGGDTNGGPLTVSVQVLGQLPAGTALRRGGGQPGDLLFVSGTPGDAAAGLALERGIASPGGLDGSPDPAAAAWLRRRFLFPEPRVALGQALRGIASACIDVSDGLATDAGKLASASGCGLRLEADRLPLSDALTRLCDPGRARDLALSGGDDYELCFTVPPARVPALQEVLERCGVAAHRIGVLTPAPGLALVADDGRILPAPRAGHDHFGGG